MNIKKTPIVGAILNLVWFGLADIYVGHLATGIAKMTVPIFVTIFIAFLTDNMQASLQLVAMCIIGAIYFPISAIVGFNTVENLGTDKL